MPSIVDIIAAVEDLAEQLARRDRFLRYRRMQLTPEQRMAEMQQLQEQAVAVLKKSPRGFAHFMARNFKKRAINVTNEDAA